MKAGPVAARVGRSCRVLRAVSGMSQEELAGRMRSFGWIRATVSNVERGRRNVTVDELIGLNQALGVDVGKVEA